MKTSLLIVLVAFATTVLTVPAMGGAGGAIGIYQDTGGEDCAVVLTAFELNPIYIVHTDHGGVTASDFSAPLPQCLLDIASEAGWVPNNWSVLVGDIDTGIHVGYDGQCQNGPVLVGYRQVFSTAAVVTACCPFWVQAHQGLEGIFATDCSDPIVDVAAVGLAAYVTVAGSIECHCQTVPTEESTWGGIKDLFSTDQ